ncbi:MAG: HIT family protein [bacterium]|jgi:ATP adenylyltransferase|nr:HIT domain-containing protein [Phycisphaerales bacterium]MCE2653325.1 HIT domain-containing protein [Planctomycetaceae bacterium]
MSKSTSGPQSDSSAAPAPAPSSQTAQPSQPAPVGDGERPLFAPWRLEYLESTVEADKAQAAQPVPPSACASAHPVSDPPSFLLDYWQSPQDDVRNHVVVRTGLGMILLNAYPYSNGHLLVALGEPRPRLLDYSAAQRAALWQLTDAACDLLETTLNPQGVNIGVNQGRAAGAGVPSHLHVHVVPRWGGDVNFMTTVGRVRVIPASLEAMAGRMRAAWPGIASRWQFASA